VDVDTLREMRDGTSELEHTGPVPLEVAKRLACDASITRVVMSGRSQPLDVGRKTPVVPPALRRAVIARDKHCRFPGCDRPAAWCDVHHIVPWEEGGPTCLENLMLMCRRHHRMLHKPHGFRLEMEDGFPVFRRPDGSILEERAPP
ncbi:MAG: HNH endonuclease, partial [Actinomycetota bacterium]